MVVLDFEIDRITALAQVPQRIRRVIGLPGLQRETAALHNN